VWAYPVPRQIPQVPMTTKTSPFDHVWEIAKKIKTCMLTTLAAKRMRSRPMHAIIDREAGCLWFITDQRGAKDEEIRTAPDVCLAFADTGSNTYLSITGRAEISHDVAKIRELWSSEARGGRKVRPTPMSLYFAWSRIALNTGIHAAIRSQSH